MFVDRLIKRIEKTNNPSVIGLDTKLEYVPDKIRKQSCHDFGTGLEGAAQAILNFNMRLVDAVCDTAPAVKLQLAYYEMYGIAGVRAFYETAEYARSKDMLVIADGKRNDIGSTAEAYSAAYLGKTMTESGAIPVFDADALTVSPYLGIDGVKPFIDDCIKYGKGIFVLVKTSNKSSGQLQDLVTDKGKPIYEIMGEYVDEWGGSLIGTYGYSSIGAVVGATYPEQASMLRNVMKNAYILVPGYGTQGGTAKDAARSFNEDGLGAVVNASRSIMCAWKSEAWSNKYGEDGFDMAARAEALRMRDELNEAVNRHRG